MISTPTRIATTPAAQAVVLADGLWACGWTQNRSRPAVADPTARSVQFDSPQGSAPVRLLIVNYPAEGGQLAELTSRPSVGSGKRSTGPQFYWRVSVFDAPPSAVLAAARKAASDDHGPTFDTATWEGWEACQSQTVTGYLQTSTFVHPTGQVTASYHYPVTPGECGGWLISAPDSYADASGHTPGPVVRALAEALLLR